MIFTYYCNDSGHELSIKISKKTERFFSEAFVIVKKMWEKQKSYNLYRAKNLSISLNFSKQNLA